MADIVFTDTGKSIKIVFGDKENIYGIKELELPKNHTPLTVEEDNTCLTFHSNGNKIQIDFNDVGTPSGAVDAVDLRDKLTNFFFREGLLIPQYPPSHNSTYAKSTTNFTSYYPYNATNPSKSLIGSHVANAWYSDSTETTNQRFHIDLGVGKTITNVMYHNSHHSGDNTNRGAKQFTMWGSNTAGDFADLVYANDGTWVPLTTSITQLDQHVALNQGDEKEFMVINSVAYRYYAFKIANSYGASDFMGIRHIELQSLF